MQQACAAAVDHAGFLQNWKLVGSGLERYLHAVQEGGNVILQGFA